MQKLPTGGAGTPESPRTSDKFGLEIQGEPPLEKWDNSRFDSRQMVEQTAPDFSSMLNDKALQQIQKDAQNDGDTPEEEIKKAEYQAWQAPIEQSTKAFEQVLKDPSKAAPLAQSIDVAKKSGSQGGIGILPTLMAALAGAAQGGGATTAGLMDKWNPENIEAGREKNRAAVAKNADAVGGYEDSAAQRDDAAQRRDPKSEISKRRAAELSELFKKRGRPEYALLTQGKSADELDKLFKDAQGGIGRAETVSDSAAAAKSKADRFKVTDARADRNQDIQQGQLDSTNANRDTVNQFNETKLKSGENQKESDRRLKWAMQQAKLEAAASSGAEDSEYIKSQKRATGRGIEKRQQKVTALKTLQSNLKKVSKSANKYSTDTTGGTGWASTLMGLRKLVDEPLESLDKEFSTLRLDAVKSFAAEAGAKAMDSNAERSALNTTQPQITDDDRSNAMILVGAQAGATKALAYAQEKEDWIAANDGLLDGFQSQLLDSVALYDPDGAVGDEPILVPRSSPEYQTAIEDGWLDPDAMVDYIVGDKQFGSGGQQSETMSAADAILGL